MNFDQSIEELLRDSGEEKSAKQNPNIAVDDEDDGDDLTEGINEEENYYTKD